VQLTEMSNWGRWGDDDERGALNLLTPERIVAAARLVQRGRVYPLSQVIRDSGVPILPGRPPNLHYMAIDGGDFAAGLKMRNYPEGVGFAEDSVFVATHGTTTHIDALAHVWKDGQLYNGFSSNTVRSYGATKCGIDKVGAIVGRGVLLDVARHHDVDVLDAGYAIGGEELGAVAAAESVDLHEGDIVLVRTGWPAVFSAAPERYGRDQPGVDADAGRYLAEIGIVALGSDNSAVDVLRFSPVHDDRPVEGRGVHTPYLCNLGIHLIEMMNLEELGADQVYEFLFVLCPLLIKGGTASPVTPIAIA